MGGSNSPVGSLQFFANSLAEPKYRCSQVCGSARGGGEVGHSEMMEINRVSRWLEKRAEEQVEALVRCSNSMNSGLSAVPPQVG